MKNKLPTKSKPFILFVLIISLSSCYFNGNFKDRIEGEGPMVTRNLDIDNFDGIIVQNSANVILIQGNKLHVEIKAQENIIENIRTEVSGNIWKIRNIRPVWRKHELTIYITMPDFNMLKISGSGDIKTDGKFDDLNNLELRISGSGDMNLDLDADDIVGRIGGSGSIRLDGFANTLDLRINGSGDIYAMELKAKRVYAKISGSGGIRVRVSEKLEADISGSGDIYYKGKPQLSTSISGSGNIHSR